MNQDTEKRTTRNMRREAETQPPKNLVIGGSSIRRALPNYFYDDLYFTEQPYGLVFGFETGLPANDSSSATLT
jgi:hypothetical protein